MVLLYNWYQILVRFFQNLILTLSIGLPYYSLELRNAIGVLFEFSHLWFDGYFSFTKLLEKPRIILNNCKFFLLFKFGIQPLILLLKRRYGNFLLTNFLNFLFKRTCDSFQFVKDLISFMFVFAYWLIELIDFFLMLMFNLLFLWNQFFVFLF